MWDTNNNNNISANDSYYSLSWTQHCMQCIPSCFNQFKTPITGTFCITSSPKPSGLHHSSIHSCSPILPATTLTKQKPTWMWRTRNRLDPTREHVGLQLTPIFKSTYNLMRGRVGGGLATLTNSLWIMSCSSCPCCRTNNKSSLLCNPMPRFLDNHRFAATTPFILLSIFDSLPILLPFHILHPSAAHIL